eukprot:5576698-Karenia_brevis.AAC.1
MGGSWKWKHGRLVEVETFTTNPQCQQKLKTKAEGKLDIYVEGMPPDMDSTSMAKMLLHMCTREQIST